jgi:hypothetical protein
MDAVKDPFIVIGNINNLTSGVAFTLTRAGVSREWVVAFINQPIIKDLVTLTGKTEGRISIESRDAKGKTIKPAMQAMRKYDINATILDKFTHEELSNLTQADLIAQINNPTNETQVKILNLFNEWNEKAKDLNTLINVSKADVNGGGKTLTDATITNDTIIELLNKKTFTNADKKLGLTIDHNGNPILDEYGLPIMNKSRMLSTYHENSLNSAIRELSPMFITQSPAFQKVVHGIAKKINPSILKSEETISLINSELYAYVVSNPESKIPSSDVASLFNGDSSIANRVDIAKKNPKLAKNLLINYLKVEIKSDSSTLRFAFMNRAKKLNIESERNIYIAWEELLEIDPKLAKDLVSYAYHSSGFSRNLGSFFDFIPTSYLKTIGFDKYITEELSILNEYSDSLMEAVDQIIKNNTNNNKLVKTISKGSIRKWSNLKTDEVFVVTDDKGSLFIGLNEVQEAEHTGFVKRADGRLYELAGYTPNREPVYVLSNKLGYNNRGRVIKEYNYYSTSDTSIIPENNVNLHISTYNSLFGLTKPMGVYKVGSTLGQQKVITDEDIIEAINKCK